MACPDRVFLTFAHYGPYFFTSIIASPATLFKIWRRWLSGFCLGYGNGIWAAPLYRADRSHSDCLFYCSNSQLDSKPGMDIQGRGSSRAPDPTMAAIPFRQQSGVFSQPWNSLHAVLHFSALYPTPGYCAGGWQFCRDDRQFQTQPESGFPRKTSIIRASACRDDRGNPLHKAPPQCRAIILPSFRDARGALHLRTS